MKYGEIRKKLKKLLPEKRYRHSLGVADTACEMAARFGCDEDKAYLTGLIHDCAKYYDAEATEKLLLENGYTREQLDAIVIPVRHADAGVFVARREFGIDDPEILRAIRLHTTGGADMTALDKVIYVADFIEPNRSPFPALEPAREAAKHDLDEAVRVCARSTVDHVRENGGNLNENTQKMLEQLNGGKEHDAE